MSQHNSNHLFVKKIRVVFACFIAVFFMIPLKTAMAQQPPQPPPQPPYATITLTNSSGLSAAKIWVLGYVGAGADPCWYLQNTGIIDGITTLNPNTGGSPEVIPGVIPWISLATLGDPPTIKIPGGAGGEGSGRLWFTVSDDPPTGFSTNIEVTDAINYVGVQAYSSPPYGSPPPAAALIPSGPFDYLEFSIPGNPDVSAVNGFGLNLSFKIGTENYGVNPIFTREQIGIAFKHFINNEAVSLPSASSYLPLLYGCNYNYMGQFFSITDPYDYLEKSGVTASGLESYWDQPLSDFFTLGNLLKIATDHDIFTGVCNNDGGVATYYFTDSQGIYAGSLASPGTGLNGALWLFYQNSYAVGLNKDLQDQIWEAFSRGVAMLGVRTSNNESSAWSSDAWSKDANWYRPGQICNIYAKFLHYSDIKGNDSRTTSSLPIFLNNAAYGFSEDENPIGWQSRFNVPSKASGKIGATTGPDTVTSMTVVIGPYGSEPPTGSFSITGTVSVSVSGALLDGVAMTLSGDSTGIETTGPKGVYSFSSLNNGSYSITPVLTGYAFSPTSRMVSINGASQLEDFTATALVPGTFVISGKVSNTNGGFERGVEMSLSGESTETTNTAADGSYSFINLKSGTYTVTPTPTDDYIFSPKSKRNIVVGPSFTDVNFTAVPPSLGTLVAHGFDFPINASELTPSQSTFTKNPRVHARYLFNGKSVEAKLKVLTKVNTDTGSPSINSLWTKRIKLYNPNNFLDAQKNGSGAIDWLNNSVNQSSLFMELWLEAEGIEDQNISPLTLQVPVIENITRGVDANEKEVFIITGKWFGTTNVRCWREFTPEEGTSIKKQNMNVVKPTSANAENYTDHNGKPAFMNSENGESKIIVRVPKKDPKGTLNGTIVIDNGVGMAAYYLAPIPPQRSTRNNDSIIVKSGKQTVPAVEVGVQNQNGTIYSNTNAYSDGTKSFAVGMEQQWIGYGQPLDNVAVNWMTCFNFSPLEWAMSGNQKQNQPEGIAKLIDIVQLYGWEGINACYTNSVGANTETLFSDDEKVLQLCKSIGKDLRPLFYFWGIIPANSDNLAAQVAAAGLTPPTEIRDLLYHYKALVPADNAAFRSFCLNYYGHQPSMGGFCFEQDHARQWSTDLLWSPDVCGWLAGSCKYNFAERKTSLFNNRPGGFGRDRGA